MVICLFGVELECNPVLQLVMFMMCFDWRLYYSLLIFMVLSYVVTVVVYMYFMLCLMCARCDIFVGFDVCGVFVVVECSLFLLVCFVAREWSGCVRCQLFVECVFCLLLLNVMVLLCLGRPFISQSMYGFDFVLCDMREVISEFSSESLGLCLFWCI